MRSNSNADLSPKSTGKGGSPEQNLEFNFDSKPNSFSNSPSQTYLNKTHQKISKSLESNIKIEPSNQAMKESLEIDKPQLRNSNPQNHSKTMTNPSFSQYQQNVHRQSREQKAVGSILSGVAITLISLIVLVAFLAGLGGWVLWRQIQNQSVTVAQLDTKFIQENRSLRSDLKQNADTFNTQIQAQKQLLTGLQSQIEEIRGQNRKDRAAEQSKFQKLENRIYDLERRFAQ